MDLLISHCRRTSQNRAALLHHFRNRPTIPLVAAACRALALAKAGANRLSLVQWYSALFNIDNFQNVDFPNTRIIAVTALLAGNSPECHCKKTVLQARKNQSCLQFVRNCTFENRMPIFGSIFVCLQWLSSLSRDHSHPRWHVRNGHQNRYPSIQCINAHIIRRFSGPYWLRRGHLEAFINIRQINHIVC